MESLRLAQNYRVQLAVLLIDELISWSAEVKAWKLPAQALATRDRPPERMLIPLSICTASNNLSREHRSACILSSCTIS